ncbi:MAG: DNA translocase FtsK 4TM domain-containing protein [Bacteroidales bacterium]|nr:DNA translocase FtsK 4TM domain-containing protein [Bacteroidales bacterium]
MKDPKVRIFAGVLILSFSTLMLLAFISYFFTWKIDQSFEWSDVFSKAEITVQNWVGKLGARLANLGINHGFGIPAFFILFFFFVVGFRLLKVKLMPIPRAFFFSSVSLILFSMVLGYLFGTAGGYLGSGPGGSHGYFMAEWMKAFLGLYGAGVCFAVLLFTYLFFAFKGFGRYIVNRFEKSKTRSVNLFHSLPKPESPETANSTATAETESETDLDDENPEYEYAVINSEDSSLSGHTAPVDAPIVDNDVELTVEETIKPEEKFYVPQEQDKLQAFGEYDPTLDLSYYKLPTLDLLEDHQSHNTQVSNEELVNNKNKIIDTLRNYNINIDKIKATIGPTVTLYEIVPAPGIRISKIKNLEDDIALSLSALGIRIIAPMPGKGTIGIEVPNMKPEIVSMRSILSSRKFQESDMELAVALGKTISNETYVFDLTKMPHLLIAGATGQGKSVGLNAILASILYKKHPAQVKFVLVDPKKVELTLYSKIERHFLAKLPGDDHDAIITDTQTVVNTLNSLCIEMENRYGLLRDAEVRNIKEYNTKFVSRKLNPMNGHRYLPYIVLVVDEFADLIMTAGRELETPIARLAQLARAVGIHLIIATQRPSVNIITGTIKANFPARIAFRVTSKIDSRTILDSGGADQLVGRGDMLLSTGNELIRLQCAFIDIPELEKLTEYIGSQQGYATAMPLPEYEGDEKGSELKDLDLSKRDDLFEEAARLLVLHQQGSTSLIQRKFSIGYNRAGRLMDQLEMAGIVGPFEGSKARTVLFADDYSLTQHLKTLP